MVNFELKGPLNIVNRGIDFILCSETRLEITVITSCAEIELHYFKHLEITVVYMYTQLND